MGSPTNLLSNYVITIGNAEIRLKEGTSRLEHYHTQQCSFAVRFFLHIYDDKLYYHDVTAAKHANKYHQPEFIFLGHGDAINIKIDNCKCHKVNSIVKMNIFEIKSGRDFPPIRI